MNFQQESEYSKIHYYVYITNGIALSVGSIGFSWACALNLKVRQSFAPRARKLSLGKTSLSQLYSELDLGEVSCNNLIFCDTNIFSSAKDRYSYLTFVYCISMM